MLKDRKDRKGFTLIELVVVVLIIGILAAIAFPMMRGFKAKAILTEAVTALGTIRIVLRMYYAEKGTYPSTSCSITFLKLFESGDLTGPYFSENCYGYGGGGSTFTLFCYVNNVDPWDNRALRGPDAASIVTPGKIGSISMNQDGTVVYTNIQGM